MQNLLNLYESFWNPSLYVLNDIEHRGIKLDVDRCLSSAADARVDQELQKSNLEAWAGTTVDEQGNIVPRIDNWDSNSQISAFLYEFKGWTPPPICGSRNAVKINFGKKPTVDYGAINYFSTHVDSAVDREAMLCLLEYRAARDDATRLEKLPTFVDENSRLHSVLSPSTDTGRLSSRNPALQQICSADRDKYGIRKAFIPETGNVFIVADYSQLELYVLAYYLIKLFKDDRLLKALQSGDIHSYVAKEAWPYLKKYPGNLKDHPDPAVQKKRKDVKSVVYGMNYGKSASGLGAAITDENGLAIGRRAAQELIDIVMSVTGADRFQKWTIAEAEQQGGVYDIYGRWRPLPDINSAERGKKRAAERKALNSPIQMSAASIVTMAMLKCNTNEMSHLQTRGYYSKALDRWDCHMVLQVHDELVFEVPQVFAEQALPVVKSLMENAHEMPLVVDAKIAENWYEGK